MMTYAITNPRYSEADKIDVEWDHPDFGPIPYTCANNSGEIEMQDIWDRLIAGEFGPIAPLEA